MSVDGPLLLAYDGSDDAKRAIESAAALLGARRALVVHAYQPFVELLTGGDVELPESIAAAAAEASRIDRAEAEATAAEGAEIARAAGLDAAALVVESSLSIWPTILAVADEHDACLVVAGSRGLSAYRGSSAASPPAWSTTASAPSWSFRLLGLGAEATASAEQGPRRRPEA